MIYIPLWYIYNGILLLSHQKNEVLPFATTWMELEDIILASALSVLFNISIDF